MKSCKHSLRLTLNPIRTLTNHTMENILKEGEQMMEGGNSNNNNNNNQGQGNYNQGSNDNQSSNYNRSGNEGSNQQQSSGNSGGGGGFMAGMKQNTEDAYVNNGKLSTIFGTDHMLIPPQRSTAS